MTEFLSFLRVVYEDAFKVLVGVVGEELQLAHPGCQVGYKVATQRPKTGVANSSKRTS